MNNEVIKLAEAKSPVRTWEDVEIELEFQSSSLFTYLLVREGGLKGVLCFVIMALLGWHWNASDWPLGDVCVPSGRRRLIFARFTPPRFTHEWLDRHSPHSELRIFVCPTHRLTRTRLTHSPIHDSNLFDSNSRTINTPNNILSILSKLTETSKCGQPYDLNGMSSYCIRNFMFYPICQIWFLVNILAKRFLD